MKRFVLIMLALIGITGAILTVGPHHVAFASAQTDVCGGVGASNAGGSGCTTSGPSVTNIIATVINILSIIAGVASVIMLMVAGLKYITAGGDSGQISSAKTTLTYALVGVVIVASAQAIVQFVLAKTGVK